MTHLVNLREGHVAAHKDGAKGRSSERERERERGGGGGGKK